MSQECHKHKEEGRRPKNKKANTVIEFDSKYFEYNGGIHIENEGLTNGGYESAYLADLVMAYILEVTMKKHKHKQLWRRRSLAVIDSSE
jgi:hypothetical protein